MSGLYYIDYMQTKSCHIVNLYANLNISNGATKLEKVGQTLIQVIELEIWKKLSIELDFNDLDWSFPTFASFKVIH